MMNGEDVLGTDLNDKVTALLTEQDWFEMPVSKDFITKSNFLLVA